MSTTITLATRDGIPLKVRARLVTEHFAVHPSPMGTSHDNAHEDDQLWTVTHLRTGFSVQWGLESFDEARRLVEHIERPELNWDFDTPLGSLLSPGCCTRLDVVHAFMARERSRETERVKSGAHRYRRAVPWRAKLYGPNGRLN